MWPIGAVCRLRVRVPPFALNNVIGSAEIAVPRTCSLFATAGASCRALSTASRRRTTRDSRTTLNLGSAKKIPKAAAPTNSTVRAGYDAQVMPKVAGLEWETELGRERSRDAVWRVRKGHELRFAHGHPWLYSNELENSPKGIEPGSPVDLRDNRGRFLARGYGNPNSLIAFRVLSRDAARREPASTSAVVQLLQRAHDLRRVLGLSHASCRLFFAEADGFSGLVVDRFVTVASARRHPSEGARPTDTDAGSPLQAPCALEQRLVFVVQAHTAGADRVVRSNLLAALERFVRDAHGEAAWRGCSVVVRNDLRVRKLDGLEEEPPRVARLGEGLQEADLHAASILVRSATPGVSVDGSAPHTLTLTADLVNGQKTGFFLDQSANIELAVSVVRGLVPAAAFCGSSSGFGPASSADADVDGQRRRRDDATAVSPGSSCDASRSVAISVGHSHCDPSVTVSASHSHSQRPPARPAVVRVLDLFCHVGHWGVQIGVALRSLQRGGGVHVTLADTSQKALVMAAANLKRCGIEGSTVRADLLAGEHSLPVASFDVVVCDPPSLIHGHKDVASGTRAYRSLFERAIELVRPGGLVVCCSCSSLLSEDAMGQTLGRAAVRLGRDVSWIARGALSPDHPTLAGFPESRYLKCWIGVVRSAAEAPSASHLDASSLAQH